MDHLHRFFQNLQGPQVRTCIGYWCAFTCSSNVPKLPDSNASATASLDDESLEEDDEAESPTREATGDPPRGGVAPKSATGEAPGDPSQGGVAAATSTDEASGDSSRGGMAAESATALAGGDSSEDGDAGGDPDATDEGVDALHAGEDAAADSTTGEATDSATGVAADSATEDNVSSSVEDDEGDCATEDGLSGPIEEEGGEAFADETAIARHT